MKTDKGDFMRNQIRNSRYGFGPLAGKSTQEIIRYKMKVALPMALYGVFYLVSFALIENRNCLRYTVIHTAVDDMIPFCEVFIIPYLLWFVYAFGFTFYLFMTDEKSYHEAATFLVIGMTVFLAVSVFFPNILLLRPETMPRHNFLTYLCERLYAIDTPTNVTPSIHVYNSLCVMIAVWHTDAKLVQTKARKLFMTFFGFLIILSTMFLKQHSFSDVLIATGFALFSYILVYRMGYVFVGNKRRKAIYESVFEH